MAVAAPPRGGDRRRAQTQGAGTKAAGEGREGVAEKRKKIGLSRGEEGTEGVDVRGRL